MARKVKGIKAAKSVALIGIMSATIECAKLALAAIPNVEAVSLLIALYSYVFGIYGVISTVVFVCIEPLIWGFNTWVATYLIYWPLLGLVFLLLGKFNVKNRFLIAGIAVFMTFFFGVLSSLVDIGLLTGFFDDFFVRFGIYYARGIAFYAVHITSNAIIFLLLFLPFLKRLEKLARGYF